MSDIARLTITVDSSDLTDARTQMRATAETADDMARGVTKATSRIGGQQGVPGATQAIQKSAGSLGGFLQSNKNGIRMTAMQLGQVADQARVTGQPVQALATQMVDLLAPLGAAGVAVGILSSFALPALAKALGNSKDQAKALDDAMGSLNDSVEAYGDAVDMAGKSVDELREKFGSQAEAIQVTLDRLSELRRVQALDDLQAAADQVADGFREISDAVTQLDAAGGRDSAIGQATLDRLNLSADAARELAGAFRDVQTAVSAEEAQRGARRLSDALVEIYGSVENIPEELRTMTDALLEFEVEAARLSGTMEREVGKVEGLANDAAAAGREIGEGIGAGAIAGLNRSIPNLIRKASEMAGSAISAAKSALGIESPSRVFEGIGRDVGDGFILGVENSRPQIVNTMTSLADTISSSIGDLFVGAFDSAEDFLNRIKSAFQRAISDLIAYAIRNPIRIAMMGSAGLAGGAGLGAQVAGGLAGGSGGGLLGGISNLLGLGGGIGGSILGSLPGATAAGSLAAGSGFLGGVGQALGLGGVAGGGFTPLAVGANAAAAGGGLMATLGAAAPIALAVGGALWLMKGSEEIVGQGLRLQVNQNMSRAQDFTKTRRTSWRFGGGSYDTDFDDLQGQAAAAILEPLEAGLQGVRDLAAQIGMGGFAAPFEFGVDLKGEDASQANIQRAIGEAIEAQASAFFQGSNAALRKEGETGVQALTRLSTALSGVNDLFTRLGKDIFSTTRAGAAAASDLVEAFGGVDQLAGALNTYYEEFFSDKERERLLYEQVTRQLQAVNLAMPETREAFRALAEAQDLNTERGREVYTTLLSVSGAFAELNPIIEETGVVIDDAADRMREAAQRARATEFESARRVVATNARSNLSGAEQDLRAAFGARSDIISQSAAGAIDAVQARMGARIGAAQSRADAMRGIRDAIKDALTSREVSDVLDPGGNLRAASQYIREVAAGRAGLDAERLQAAMDVVARPSTDLFSSFTEYQREFQKNTAALREIEERTGGSASAAERTVREITESRDQQVRAIENARDTQLAALEAQLNAILGVEGATLSVASAIGNYQEAAAEAERARTTTEGGFQKGSFGAQLDAIYRDLLGRGVRTEGLEYYGAQYVSGVPLSTIRASIEASAERARYLETGIPRFTGGGYTGNRPRSGGLDGQGGFMAMLHPRETVVDHTRADGGDMAAMRRELKEQRELLKQVQRDTERTRKRADQWTVDGLLTRTS